MKLSEKLQEIEKWPIDNMTPEDAAWLINRYKKLIEVLEILERNCPQGGGKEIARKALEDENGS